MDEMANQWTHGEVTVRNVRFHFVEAGKGEGRPMVVLLHGFPEFWYSWRHQIPALAAAGFHVIAPDLRGYNLTEKSRGVYHYHIEHLTDDVAALIEVWGAQRADVVGHDWGGMIAWFFAMRHPQRLQKLVVMNAAHPGAYFRELKGPRQLLKSWYVFMFQVPKMTEWMLRATGYRGLRKTFKAAGFAESDIDQYEAAWRQPGAMTGGLNYYRAAFRRAIRGSLQKVVKPIDVPTLLIWGEDDPFATPRVLERLEPWVRQLRIERLPGVGHWVQNQAPGRVNELVTDFLLER